jgi:hypothetical protein
MTAAIFLISALLPDCRVCGHVAVCHMTGMGHCAGRRGWRRKRCSCRGYAPPAMPEQFEWAAGNERGPSWRIPPREGPVTSRAGEWPPCPECGSRGPHGLAFPWSGPPDCPRQAELYPGRSDV